MDTVTIDKKQFETILAKLDRVTDVLALNIVRDYDKQKDKISGLSSLGYGVTDIAKLLNTTAGTVNQALVRSRKEKIEKDAKTQKPVKETNVETNEGDPSI